MIVQKPADLNPAMKSALKNHIMRKRQQLKQELEQDAIEKRLKREQEAKRKQDAMTLDQLKEQLNQLEKTLDDLKNEKHSLFAQLKQNMRVLNEDDTRRKQKEGELNAARQQQQNEQNRQQLQQQQQNQSQNQQQPLQQQTVSNGSLQHSSIANQENHIPTSKDKSHDPPVQQPHLYHQQTNQHEQDTPPTNSHQLNQPTPHMQRPNSIFNSAAAFSHLLNAHSFSRQSPYLTHLPQSNRSSNPYGPMSSYPPLGHHPPPSLISGHGIPTSMTHVPQPNPMIRPSPPPMPNNSSQLNAGTPKLSLSLPITSSGPPTSMDFNPNLATSTAHQMQQQAMNSTAAATAAALGLPYGSSYFNSNSPIGPTISSHQPLDHHAALNAAAAAAANHNHLSGNGNNQSNSGNNNVNGASNSSHCNPLPPMKRPISATSLANDTLSPNKKVHTQPPPSQNLQHQLPSSLSNPYLGYPGLPPGLNPSGGPSLPTNLFGPGLIRTPPPPNISSLFNSAAFSHLLNTHSFPRQSPYLTHLPQPNRSSNPYGPMGSYPPLGHHPPSLISGHGIPTSMSHVPQPNPMIRPSPPPMSNNPGQLNAGAPKLSLSLPITSSGPPTPMDFNPNLATPTAHQMQQHAINNSAAVAAAALGISYGSPYFNSNSPIGPPITSHQALEHHAALNAAAAAAAAASTHNILSGNSNNPNSSNNNIKSRVAPYQ